MNSTPPSDRSTGLGARLWRRPRRWWLLGIPLGGLLALVLGVALTGGFIGSLKFAETTPFCISCHEMSYAHQELKQSVHGSNEFGVTAGCGDCHIPPAFLPGLMRHMEAVGEVIGHFQGKLDTPAKYEAQRAAMASKIWAEFKANDSAECRHCHTPASMDFAKQPPMAAQSHKSLAGSGMTCIDCHRGVAHTLPQGG